MDEWPTNYESYSYIELLDVRKHIDREKYPERLRVVEDLLLERKDEEPELEETSFDDKLMLGYLSFEVLFWLIVIFSGCVGFWIW